MVDISRMERLSFLVERASRFPVSDQARLMGSVGRVKIWLDVERVSQRRSVRSAATLASKFGSEGDHLIWSIPPVCPFISIEGGLVMPVEEEESITRRSVDQRRILLSVEPDASRSPSLLQSKQCTLEQCPVTSRWVVVANTLFHFSTAELEFIKKEQSINCLIV